ncbi:MAG: Ig-like domain-containing protein, partial [Thermoflexales bacterium]|nr:Ig-like domain-containing protein [Thermoflexales bacterium]
MKRSLSILISSALVLAALLGAWLVLQPRALAAPLMPPSAPQATALSVYPSSIPADTTDGNCATGTPYAVFMSATGLDAGLSYVIKGYHYRTADTNNKGCFWNWQTASWVAIDNTYNGLPTISGVTEWSGWLYLKAVVGHAGTADMKLRVRVRTGATNSDATVTPVPMDMTTAGGWIAGHAHEVSGVPLAGGPVIIRNGGGAIVGVYAAEDNTVAEGYTTGDTGFYQVAAPIGTGLTAEVWNNGVLTGTAKTDITVQANTVTPNTDINVLDVTPPGVSATVPISTATGVSPYLPLSATFSEALDPATVTDATFTLDGPQGNVPGTVTYAGATRTATFALQGSLAAQTSYTATLSTSIKDLAGNTLVVPYVWSFTTGDGDSISPTIASRLPASNAISVPLNSRLVITFSEDLKPSTVIAGNFMLVGPQGAIGWSAFTYDAVAFKVTATPIVLLPTSRYTMTVDNVTDWAGNGLSGVKTWSFTTDAEPVLTAYHGDLHNHTSYSDGSLTAATAYATGRANGFDFMAVTDHSYAVDDGEWADMLAASISATVPGEFVALRGVEYTQGAEGHINVINTVRHAVRTNTGCAFCDYTPNLEKGQTVDGFYNWLSITGTVGLNGEATIAQFNHPGWINFNDWTFHPEVSATMKLEEVGNGSGTSYAFSEDEYIRSLDYGWKVGATNNADTHSPYWGSNTPHRTGTWLPALTKADLLDALEARRTFATEDKTYELKFKGNGAWMGSEIPNTGSVLFDVAGFDPDNEGSALVQLISFGGAVITQTNTTSTFSWQPIVPVAPGVHYFYVKVTQADGDRIVSSPIWTQGAVNVALTDLAVEPTIATIYNPSLITARVSNREAQTRTVTVTFSINNVDQASLSAAVPPCVTGPCVDGFASITWQPAITGPVTITARITGTPLGDNPDDDARTTYMTATDEKVPLVLIDAGHGNIASTPRDVRTFVNDLTAHGYNVLLNLDAITASDLNTETVKLLIINAYGPTQM